MSIDRVSVPPGAQFSGRCGLRYGERTQQATIAADDLSRSGFPSGERRRGSLRGSLVTNAMAALVGGEARLPVAP